LRLGGQGQGHGPESQGSRLPVFAGFGFHNLFLVGCWVNAGNRYVPYGYDAGNG
jgi:hypothetical protein